MAEGQPIKEQADVAKVSKFLLKWYGQDVQDLFLLNLNLALRVSDCLNITMAMARTGLADRESHMVVTEGKTKKTKRIRLNYFSKEILQRRLEEYPDDHYLFQSHAKNLSVGTVKPLTRSWIYSAIRDAGQHIDLHLGTHSMRKTRGYMLYKSSVPIEVIQKMFNHSHPAVTLRYIGITQQTVDATFDELVITG